MERPLERISVGVGDGHRDVGLAREALLGAEHQHAVFFVGEDVDRTHHDVGQRTIACSGGHVRNRREDIEAFDKLAEHGVIEIETSRRAFGDEELRIVGVVAALGHRQDAGAVVLQVEVELVVEIAQRRAARSSFGRVSTLDDEVVDNAMEDDAVEEIVSRQFDESVGGPAGAALEQLEHHVAEVLDRNAHAAVTFQHGRAYVGIVAADGVGQLAAVGIESIERNVQRRAAQQHHVFDLQQEWVGGRR